ncbi:MAG: fluoride efflux transporter CrcB [Porphyromonadaceae bacterium]|nr:fluoride efflux transporter CrcB [Porphyromonadaceae bacterium]
MKQLLIIGLGGFIGSVARYLVSKLNLTWQLYNIPVGTLLVNITGSLLIGFFAGFFVHNVTSSEYLKLFFITGICGGFTTFSAFSFENLHLIQEGYITASVFYIALSVVFGILAVLMGLWISKMIV